jgi:hypothetical protein
MTGLPSRILYAVPRTLEKRLEIAKAIQTLAATEKWQQVEPNAATANFRAEHDLIAEIVKDALRILRKAGFNPNEPRVPAGNPDAGQWTTGSTQGGVRVEERPSDQPPEIPSQELLTAKTRNVFLKPRLDGCSERVWRLRWVARLAITCSPSKRFIGSPSTPVRHRLPATAEDMGRSATGCVEPANRIRYPSSGRADFRGRETNCVASICDPYATIGVIVA